ncbi:MAG: TonB-dependent receptor, partial [Gloeobacteraceae cyanobacterium ES-bin-316]|nr:TonB-dependent receptor [Ferruginibacter sp.]
MLVIIFCLVSITMMGQKISGVVKDETGKPFAGSTITLLRAKDSVAVKYTATKADGQYQFEALSAGDFMVKSSHVGHKTGYSAVINLQSQDVTVPDMLMAKASANLGEVVVTAKKPMVEIKADRTILNVEGTINAVGTDALELLRKSPGVMVDKDDNLSLSGKNGVQVYIDGRPTPLAGKDLADFLKSMQSSNVEAIEIITNPSAKYEAAGNGGIINIRL